MYRGLATTLLVALCGCAPQGAWQPTVSPTPGFENGIPRDAFSDGCRVEWDSLLLGIVSGALLDTDQLATAFLPGDQAVELNGSGGTTLAQVHLPSGTQQSEIQLQLGPPALVVSAPYEGPCPAGPCGDDGRGAPANPMRGNASPEQRALLRDEGIAGRISGRLYCGKGTELRFDWDLPEASISCPIDNWELKAADSATTWLDFAFQDLFATASFDGDQASELAGRHWLEVDLDENGALDSQELSAVSAESIGLAGPSHLADWLSAQATNLVSISEGSACSWSEEGS